MPRSSTTGCSRGGSGLGTEYRYMLAPQSQGNLRYYYLNEKEAVINGLPQPARRARS